MNKQQLIEQLREEVTNVKDCFTKFSFQTIAISIPTLGIIENFQKDLPEISLCSLLIMVFALMVAKIGAHKYNTANRNLAFLLYQERRNLLPFAECKIFRDEDDIAWEEAMRAWRVVQATVFQTIYNTNPILPNFVKIKCDNKKKYRWFNAKKIANTKGASYYPGSYLRNMQYMLFFIAFIALLPPLHVSILLYTEHHKITTKVMIIAIITFFSILYFLWRIFRLTVRRKILEQGLLCIQSSAILWEAIVISYNLALVKSQANDKQLHPLQEFAPNLAKIASELKEKEHVCAINRWIEDKKNEIKVLTQQSH